MHPVYSWLAADTGLSAQHFEVTFLLAGWQVHEHRVAGELAAAALHKGTEVHFVCAPSWRKRLIRRRNTQEFLAPLLAKRGYLTTRVQVSEKANDMFVRRIGFKKTWSDGKFVYYMLTELPFSRTAR